MPLKNGLLTQAELMNLPESELFVRIDQALDGTASDWRFMLGQLYRDELVRRRQDAANASMLAWTRQVRNMTIVILLLTLANVVAIFWHH
jgi:hypothetical protein